MLQNKTRSAKAKKKGTKAKEEEIGQDQMSIKQIQEQIKGYKFLISKKDELLMDHKEAENNVEGLISEYTYSLFAEREQLENFMKINQEEYSLEAQNYEKFYNQIEEQIKQIQNETGDKFHKSLIS